MPLPLSALLSQALVAFIIGCDNEFEHQMPHRTSNFGSTGSGQGSWLVSMVMWWNCLRFVGADGVRAGELEGSHQNQLGRNATVGLCDRGTPARRCAKTSPLRLVDSRHR